MSTSAAGTLSPAQDQVLNLTQNTAALIDSPAFAEFLTGLWTRGRVILNVRIDQMMPHEYQREIHQGHIMILPTQSD
jgi:hypothetical protein